ncbi:MAG: branched-chain amino acid aminotransferase [Candidatus Latescibacteria bacterium]|nr:branched-chain amino acid aminotransferase [Candidatus Latescibacterota bacterium]
MAQRLVYFNGDFIPEQEARISIFDCALMYGDMVFEMTRSFNQQPYRLRHHLERLYASLKYTQIDCGLSLDQMEAATLQTIERNRAALEGFDFQIMHDITRGALPLYETLVREGTDPIVSINVIPLVRHTGAAAAQYDTGAHFVITPQQSVPARYIDPKAKNRSRLAYKLAELQAAHMEEGAQALLTDERGFITEGTGNNFFMVKDGRILTPKPHDILRGVSRQACMELADGLDLPVEEADIGPYDVREADEAWYTSTTICMIPITRFNFQPVGQGCPGPLYRQLLAAWSRDVGVDIAAQAHTYSQLAKTWTP